MSEENVKFNREAAFSRTVGWVTEEELRCLRDKTVAIAGLGGVGAIHFLTLTRLGVGGFHLAEFDTFGIENFNRQIGADMTTIGRKKLDVMKEQALRINPELRIKTFPDGINSGNLDEFLEGADAYADGLDYFAFKERGQVFKACFEKNIPATTAGPIGMGAALLNFIPGKMSFHDYFQWKESDSEETLAVKFLVGLAPSMPHRSYLVDPRALDFKAKKGPSTPMACELCAGVVGTEILKILLNRGKVHTAPRSLHFDAYLNRYFTKHIPLGNRNPIQRIKIAVGLRILNRKKEE